MSYAASSRPSTAGGDPWAWRQRRASARVPAPTQPRQGRRPRLALFAALALAIGVGAWAAHSHSARMSHWAQPLLREIGYPWRATDVKVETFTGRLVAEGRATALVVEGEIANVGKQEIDAPALRLAVRTADRDEIFVWTAHPVKTHLAPGERSRFSSRLEAPPSSGVDVAVALESKGD